MTICLFSTITTITATSTLRTIIITEKPHQADNTNILSTITPSLIQNNEALTSYQSISSNTNNNNSPAFQNPTLTPSPFQSIPITPSPTDPSPSPATHRQLFRPNVISPTYTFTDIATTNPSRTNLRLSWRGYIALPYNRIENLQKSMVTITLSSYGDKRMSAMFFANGEMSVYALPHTNGLESFILSSVAFQKINESSMRITKSMRLLPMEDTHEKSPDFLGISVEFPLNTAFFFNTFSTPGLSFNFDIIFESSYRDDPAQEGISFLHSNVDFYVEGEVNEVKALATATPSPLPTAQVNFLIISSREPCEATAIPTLEGYLSDPIPLRWSIDIPWSDKFGGGNTQSAVDNRLNNYYGVDNDHTNVDEMKIDTHDHITGNNSAGTRLGTLFPDRIKITPSGSVSFMWNTTLTTSMWSTQDEGLGCDEEKDENNVDNENHFSDQGFNKIHFPSNPRSTNSPDKQFTCYINGYPIVVNARREVFSTKPPAGHSTGKEFYQPYLEVPLNQQIWQNLFFSSPYGPQLTNITSHHNENNGDFNEDRFFIPPSRFATFNLDCRDQILLYVPLVHRLPNSQPLVGPHGLSVAFISDHTDPQRVIVGGENDIIGDKRTEFSTTTQNANNNIDHNILKSASVPHSLNNNDIGLLSSSQSTNQSTAALFFEVLPPTSSNPSYVLSSRVPLIVPLTQTTCSLFHINVNNTSYNNSGTEESFHSLSTPSSPSQPLSTNPLRFVIPMSTSAISPLSSTPLDSHQVLVRVTLSAVIEMANFRYDSDTFIPFQPTPSFSLSLNPYDQIVHLANDHPIYLYWERVGDGDPNDVVAPPNNNNNNTNNNETGEHDIEPTAQSYILYETTALWKDVVTSKPFSLPPRNVDPFNSFKYNTNSVQYFKLTAILELGIPNLFSSQYQNHLLSNQIKLNYFSHTGAPPYVQNIYVPMEKWLLNVNSNVQKYKIVPVQNITIPSDNRITSLGFKSTMWNMETKSKDGIHLIFTQHDQSHYDEQIDIITIHIKGPYQFVLTLPKSNNNSNNNGNANKNSNRDHDNNVNYYYDEEKSYFPYFIPLIPKNDTLPIDLKCRSIRTTECFPTDINITSDILSFRVNMKAQRSPEARSLRTIEVKIDPTILQIKPVDILTFYQLSSSSSLISPFSFADDDDHDDFDVDIDDVKQDKYQLNNVQSKTTTTTTTTTTSSSLPTQSNNHFITLITHVDFVKTSNDDRNPRSHSQSVDFSISYDYIDSDINDIPSAFGLREKSEDTAGKKLLSIILYALLAFGILIGILILYLVIRAIRRSDARKALEEQERMKIDDGDEDLLGRKTTRSDDNNDPSLLTRIQEETSIFKDEVSTFVSGIVKSLEEYQPPTYNDLVSNNPNEDLPQYDYEMESLYGSQALTITNTSTGADNGSTIAINHVNTNNNNNNNQNNNHNNNNIVGIIDTDAPVPYDFMIESDIMSNHVGQLTQSDTGGLITTTTNTTTTTMNNH